MAEGSEKLFEKFGRLAPKGTILIKEGEPGTEMFIIQAGKVRIFKRVGDVDKTLATLGPGEFFGEMAIVNNKPRAASVEVMEDAKLLAIDSNTLDAMIRGNPDIAIRIIRKLAERLRDADNQIEGLLIKDHNRKVVHILKRVAEEKGEQVAGGVKIPIGISEIATLTALDKNIVNEVIEKLRKARLISQGENHFIVEDVKKLDKFLEYLAMKEQFGEM